MNVVTCWHCLYVFGQDEDKQVASEILRKTKEKHENCPRCGKPLEVTISWSSRAMDNRSFDVVREINLDSDNPPDPFQIGKMLRDDIQSIAPKKKKKWKFWK